MYKKFEKFKWTITNFSNLCYHSLESENFNLSGYSWQIGINVTGRDELLSIYLEALGRGCGENWSRLAKFKFSLINQVNSKMTITKEAECQLSEMTNEAEYWFNKSCPETGFEAITLDDLLDSRNGFTLNDICIIEVEISVSHSEDEKLIDNVQVCDELIDFRGLGKIEKAFVPLLEKVCTWYPSLVECQQKRSPRFREWAFTALGEALHFLKTKKVKDMNEDACNHLQILWEELETFKFDLSWLEPHFEHALNMKSYISRAEEVKKMKENVAALEMELEKARRDLVRAEEGIEEMQVDAELGYGGPGP